MTTIKTELRDVTRVLLDAARSAYSLRAEVLDLRSIFEDAGGLAPDSAQDIASGELVTGGGVAISPTMAAMCLDDYARTVQFIRGVHDAIADLQRCIGGRSVRVLYAGCGPFAPLAIPLMSIFPGDAVRFTLLDIHQRSIASVTKILEHLDLFDRIDAIENKDAAEYRIDEANPPDVIVVEMLRPALESEPQVSVTRHLLRVARDAVIIPREVRIDLTLVDRTREFSTGEAPPERCRVHLATVFLLNKDTSEGSADGEAVRVELPDYDVTRFDPMLLTSVHVYGDHVLRDYDSGITCPRKIDVAGGAGPGDTIEFIYRTGRNPKLTARKI